MKKRIFVCLLLAALIGSTARTAHATNLLINGSFELGNYNNTGGYQRLDSGNTDVLGWTIGAEGVDWHVGTANPGLNPAFINPHFGPAKDGSLVMDLNLDGGSAGTISQSFATTIGMLYNVSFFLAGDSFFTDPRFVQVDIGGTTQLFSQAASPQYEKVWGLQSFQFTATDTASTLTFISPDVSGFWGPLLDDVQVEASVPEPNSLALTAVGIFGIATLIRRRNQTTA